MRCGLEGRERRMPFWGGCRCGCGCGWLWLWLCEVELGSGWIGEMMECGGLGKA